MKKIILLAAALVALAACKPVTPAAAPAQQYFPTFSFAALAYQSNGRIDTVLPISVITTTFDTLSAVHILHNPDYFTCNAYPDTVYVGEVFTYPDSTGSGQVRIHLLSFSTPTPLTIDTQPYIADDKGTQWVIVHSK